MELIKSMLGDYYVAFFEIPFSVLYFYIDL